MGTTNAIFTGSSQFSQDFQNVMTRAVSIASLPLTQLNSDLTSLQNQSSALSGIDSRFAALQGSLSRIQAAVGGSAMNVSSSNNDVLQATVGEGAVEGTYPVKVVDAGANSTSMTTASWVAPANLPGQTHTYQLWIGGRGDPKNEIDITPADNTAQSVAAAINAKAGDKVHATAMNIGSALSPDWRISMQSAKVDNISMEIADGGGPDLQTQTAGWKAQYVVSKIGQTQFSDTRSIEVATGVTVNLIATDADFVDVTVSRSTVALKNALSDLVSSYNSAVDSVDQNRGSSQGALHGESTVDSLGQALRAISTYSSSDTQFSGLRSLGLELESNGHLSFDMTKLDAAITSNPAGVGAFFGSTTNSGFLKAATDVLNSIEDADTGVLKSAEAGVQKQITDTKSRISVKQDQVDKLQVRLAAQMSAADAAIAAMEQQYSYLSNMFASMQTAAQQYK
jgi:flagellar hook-associated protein 2